MKVKELREILDFYSEEAEIYVNNYEPFMVVEMDGDLFIMDTASDDIIINENNFEE